MNNLIAYDNAELDALEASAGQAITGATDISKDKAELLSLLPEDSFQKKLELIEGAEDMSTQEKLNAIGRAEDKRISDLQQGAEIQKGILMTKKDVVITCILVAAMAFSSPQVRRFISDSFRETA